MTVRVFDFTGEPGLTWRDFIRAARLSKGWSVREAGAQVGLVGETAYNALERGGRDVAPKEIDTLALLFTPKPEAERYLRLLVDLEDAQSLGAETQPLEERLLALRERARRDEEGGRLPQDLEELIAASRRLQCVDVVAASAGSLYDVRRAAVGGVPADAAVTDEIAVGFPGPVDEELVRFHLSLHAHAEAALRALGSGGPRGGASGPQFLGFTEALGERGARELTARLRECADLLYGAATANRAAGARKPYLLQLESFPLTRRLPGPPLARPANIDSDENQLYLTQSPGEFVRHLLKKRSRKKGRGRKKVSMTNFAETLGVNRSTLWRNLTKGMKRKVFVRTLVDGLVSEGVIYDEDAEYLRLLFLTETERGGRSGQLREELVRVRARELGKKHRLTMEALESWVFAALNDMPACTRVMAGDAELASCLQFVCEPGEFSDAIEKLVRLGMHVRDAMGASHNRPAPTWMRVRADPGELDSSLHAYHLAMHGRAEAWWRGEGREATNSIECAFRDVVLWLSDEQYLQTVDLLGRQHRGIAELIGGLQETPNRVQQVNLRLVGL